jgi:hypothetical protein
MEIGRISVDPHIKGFVNQGWLAERHLIETDRVLSGSHFSMARARCEHQARYSTQTPGRGPSARNNVDIHR